MLTVPTEGEGRGFAEGGGAFADSVDLVRDGCGKLVVEVGVSI